jgi:hypothetical protein
LTLRLEPSGAAIAHDDLGCYSTKASTVDSRDIAESWRD